MNPKGTLSKSGVFVYNSYKDNIIIDRYNSVFKKMRGSKLNALCSENSEDVITWNVFRTLQKIDQQIWLPGLFREAFQSDLMGSEAKIYMWKKVNTPETYPVDEGVSEIDIVIENEQVVWFIEAKYKSDVSMSTTNDSKRNQVLRNIDVGSNYAGEKDFYFSLLILDEGYSPKGVKLIDTYCRDVEVLHQALPHREDYVPNLRGVSLLKWRSFVELFRLCEKQAEYEDERFLAEIARRDLERRL